MVDFGVVVTMRSTLAALFRGTFGSARFPLGFVGVDIFHISRKGNQQPRQQLPIKFQNNERIEISSGSIDHHENKFQSLKDDPSTPR